MEGLKLKAGDWVEVRTKEEILATLDSNGELEQMPFMPEMLAFCGKRFQVYKRAHKTCDTVFPVRGRRLDRAVHLTTRCDGQWHGGCQAGCLLFWKEAWLKPLGSKPPNDVVDVPEPRTASLAPLTFVAPGKPDLQVLATRPAVGRQAGPAYVCQATRLPYATSRLAWWDIRQYIEDYWSGNAGLRRILSGFCYSAYYNLSQAGLGLGRPMESMYDGLHRLWGGTMFPWKTGVIPVGHATPEEPLNLQPGELVRVKSHTEILRTLTIVGKNRGLLWGAEMVPYCGKTYRVLKRVTRIVDEKTGQMQIMKSPCIILDGVTCQSRYSSCRMFCPRSIYPYWREVWLERVALEPAEGVTQCNGARSAQEYLHARNRI